MAIKVIELNSDFNQKIQVNSELLALGKTLLEKGKCFLKFLIIIQSACVGNPRWNDAISRDWLTQKSS